MIFKRATPINLILVATIAIAAASIVAIRWPTSTVATEPPTTYVEAVAMRNAALNALARLERDLDAAEPNSAEQKRLSAGIEPQIAEIRRLEKRIEELKN